MHYYRRDTDINQIRKMQKDRVREMIKYLAKNVTPNDINSAFKLVGNSVTYMTVMNEDTGLWCRPVSDTIKLIQKEVANDMDGWEDIVLQFDKYRKHEDNENTDALITVGV